MQFDYSEFHPLDHGIWDPVCWGWAGGIPRHIKLWWNYQHNWPWQDWQARRSCDKGLHHMVAYWNGEPIKRYVWGDQEWEPEPDGYQCRDCDLELK